MIKLSCIIRTFFLDTISPLSEQSLSSPVEDGGGYQSEVRIETKKNSKFCDPIKKIYVTFEHVSQKKFLKNTWDYWSLESAFHKLFDMHNWKQNLIRNPVALKAVLCEMGQEEEKFNTAMGAEKVTRAMANTVVKTVYQIVLTAHKAWIHMLRREVQVSFW